MDLSTEGASGYAGRNTADVPVTDEFAVAIRTAVEERTGVPVDIKPVLKNNGVKLTGLTVKTVAGLSGKIAFDG